MHYDSEDRIQWRKAKNFHISDRIISWEDGTTHQFDHLERPQVLMENGNPIALICAADNYDENHVRQSFNVQIPLIITEEY